MLNLSEEQQKKLMSAINEHIQEETKKSMTDFDKTLDNVTGKLKNIGWTLPAELGIYAVNVIGNMEEISNIEKFFEMYFTQDDYKFTRKMIENILDAPISEGLKKMVRECWTAFQNKLYAVCATSLLSVIEGVLSEFSDDKSDVRMMKVCQKHVDEFPADGSSILKHVWISYNNFIRNLYQKSDFKQDEPDEVNRHWLLHGRSDFEIEEIDCLRLFNAVDSLCMVVKKENKEAETN
ncbi:hypothetical protein ACTNEW_07825 [Blautia sp. HCP3S3_G3]|uniref:hypothetical protein n=1 Tax=Blautia sp. HCP3S3_G3 TaxID=3438913 RepID=UPI003F8BCB02